MVDPEKLIPPPGPVRKAFQGYVDVDVTLPNLTQRFLDEQVNGYSSSQRFQQITARPSTRIGQRGRRLQGELNPDFIQSNECISRQMMPYSILDHVTRQTGIRIIEEEQPLFFGLLSSLMIYLKEGRNPTNNELTEMEVHNLALILNERFRGVYHHLLNGPAIECLWRAVARLHELQLDEQKLWEERASTADEVLALKTRLEALETQLERATGSSLPAVTAQEAPGSPRSTKKPRNPRRSPRSR